MMKRRRHRTDDAPSPGAGVPTSDASSLPTLLPPTALQQTKTPSSSPSSSSSSSSSSSPFASWASKQTIFFRRRWRNFKQRQAEDAAEAGSTRTPEGEEDEDEEEEEDDTDIGLPPPVPRPRSLISTPRQPPPTPRTAAATAADAEAAALAAAAAAAARQAKEQEEEAVRRQQLWKLKGFLGVYTTLLVVSFAFSVWADLTWLVPQLLKVSLALQVTSAVFFCLVVPLTHFSGTFFFRQWKFWQPFQGGTRFIVFQAISWTFYALCLVLAVCCLLFWSSLVKYTFGLMTSFGVFGVLSQVFMVTSLVVYERRQQQKQQQQQQKQQQQQQQQHLLRREEEEVERKKKELPPLPMLPARPSAAEVAAAAAAEKDEDEEEKNSNGQHHDVQQQQQQQEREQQQQAGGGLIPLLEGLYKEIFFQHHLALAIVAVGLAILAECLWTMEEGGREGGREGGGWGGMVGGHQKDFARAAGLLSVLLFAAVVFSTYGVGGQVAGGNGENGGREGGRDGGREGGREHQKAVRKQWRFWQPFLGGAKFMLLQGLSWSFFTVSIVVEILFVISTFAVGFELFVGAAVVAGGFFLVSEVLMIVSLHFYMPTTTTTTTTGLAVVVDEEEMVMIKEGVVEVDVRTAATTTMARLRTKKQVLVKETATITTTTTTTKRRSSSKTTTSFMPVRVDEASLEQFRRLTVITVLSNMQYLPFLLPILPFLLSGLPLPLASFHWFGAFCCLTSAVVVNAYVKTMLAKAGHRLSSFHRSILHALPLLVYAAPGVCSFWAWKQQFEYQNNESGREEGTEGAVSAFPAWAALTAILYSYIFLTFRGKPEVTGERYLGEKLELWKGGWSLYWFLEGIDQYFQAKFIFMDPELDLKGKPHVFAFHPHGVQPFTTCWIQLSRAWREGVGKGQRFCVMTASVMHYVPLMRDILQWLGGREVSKEAISFALSRQESVLLVPGGQQEMMESQSQMGEIRIITKHVGFIRLALQTGAPLVPVLSFGEVEIMDFVRYPRLQRFFITRIGIPVPFFPYGLFGFPIPRPVPVTVVFGRPILVERVEEPTQEEVRKLSKKYFESIQEVFDKNKAGALGHENHRLVLL